MQVSHHKKVYYALCTRIQQQCLAATELEPFTRQQALDCAVQGVISSMRSQGSRAWSLSKYVKDCKQLEAPSQYEGRVLKWSADVHMPQGNPGKHSKKHKEAQAARRIRAADVHTS